MKGRKLVFTEEQQAEIKSLYESGLRIIDVARHFGVSYTGMRLTMLRIGVEIRHPNRKYTINHNAFDRIDTEHVAYWYGFIYADGCVRKTYLQIMLHPQDAAHLESLSGFLGSDSPIWLENYANIPRARLTVYSIQMTKRLRRLGILPHRPVHQPIFEEVPESLFSHWLRGFFDGDGYAGKKTREEIAFCGKLELMKAIRKKIRQNTTSSSTGPIFEHQSGNVHYLKYKGYGSARPIIDYMYLGATVWLPRKRAKLDSWELRFKIKI